VALGALDGLSSIRIQMKKGLQTKEDREMTRKAILEVQRRFPDGIPPLDPIEHMGIKDETFKRLIRVCMRYLQFSENTNTI
jgi:ATP-dependent RNA helicase DOB1